MKHLVKRAIILAAGYGSRLRPITLTTPKPLIKVNGTRMIDSIIEALHINGIEEIIVVVGYLKEMFDYLKDKYPGVSIIENPYYEKCNNISSLYVAREYIEESIILDGDQIVNNHDILGREFSRSGYNAVHTDVHTDEWLLELDGEIIKRCSRNGGKDGWQLYSISRWTKNDGKKLKRHLEIEFEQNHNYDIYWDDVALFCYSSEYELGVWPMEKEDVIEIDSLEELKVLDSSYSDINRL